MKWIGLIAVILASSAFAAEYTTVTVEGIDSPVLVQITGMQVKIPVQCEEKFCDSADTDCDGVLDNTCPGLAYNVCKDGSIVESYMDAALTGFCIQEQAVDVVYCDEGVLVVSPSVCVERPE